MIAGIFVLSVVGCHDPAGAASDLPLIVNHARWKSQYISDYEFAFQRHCFCRGAATALVTIRVANRQVTDVRDSLGLPIDSALVAQHFDVTIDSLFGAISWALRNGQQLEVRYDPGLGYPVHIAIDRHQGPRDGGLAFSARLLRTLPR